MVVETRCEWAPRSFLFAGCSLEVVSETVVIGESKVNNATVMRGVTGSLHTLVATGGGGPIEEPDECIEVREHCKASL